MKKLFLSIAIFGAFCLIQAQTGEDWYQAENDEHSSDASATEIVTSEPIIVTTIGGNSEPAVQETSNATPDMDMTASVEAGYSKFSKKISIPLWYRWKEFSVNALIPYFISKEVDNFGGGDNYSVSGLGDVSVGTSYGKYLDQYNTYLDANFSVKMPTGDPEASDKIDGIKQIIPLGSDTWDFSLALSGYYFMDAFTFRSSVLYKLNGIYTLEDYKYNSTTMKYEDVDADVGDLFIFTGGMDYRWQYRLTFGLGLLYGNHMAGEIDGVDYKNGLQFIDLIPSVKYSYSLFEFVLGAKIPVSTTAEDDVNNKENRNFNLFLRTNYRIF